MSFLLLVDDVLRRPDWAPRWGWHDDHRQADRTPAYLPAIQQVRAEFGALLDAMTAGGIIRRRGRGLQLGMGECDASHAVWSLMFNRMVTIDFRTVAVDAARQPGLDTASPKALRLAEEYAPFDFLFIDAGHLLEDVERDHRIFAPLVREGGMIAFHDALKRPGYEDEVHVWRHLETLEGVTVAGDEVGVAWTFKR